MVEEMYNEKTQGFCFKVIMLLFFYKLSTLKRYQGSSGLHMNLGVRRG